MVPGTFRAAQFAGRYAFSHVPSGTTRVMGFVDTRGEQPFYHRADFAAHDLAADLATGDLYALDAADRRSVVEFDCSNASERASYMWRSRPFYSGRPVSIGAVFVEATAVRAGSEVRIYGDGNLIGTIPGSQFNTVARVRSGRWNEIQVEAAGASTIARISIGQMPDEVRL